MLVNSTCIQSTSNISCNKPDIVDHILIILAFHVSNLNSAVSIGKNRRMNGWCDITSAESIRCQLDSSNTLSVWHLWCRADIEFLLFQSVLEAEWWCATINKWRLDSHNRRKRNQINNVWSSLFRHCHLYNFGRCCHSKRQARDPMVPAQH